MTYHLKLTQQDGTFTKRDFPSRADAVAAAVTDMRDTADEMETWVEDLPRYAKRVELESPVRIMSRRLWHTASRIEGTWESGGYPDPVTWPGESLVDSWMVQGHGFIGWLRWEVWSA